MLRALLGALMVLVALAWPRGPAEAATSPSDARVHLPGAATFAVDGVGELDGGACDETEEQEQIDCAAQVERTPDEPVLVALMRALGVEMSEQACTELLTDVWADESCQAQGRDCGKMNSGAPASPTPKLASSSTSARSSLAGLGLDGDPSLRLGRFDDARPLSSRDLQPPVPPPKLRAC